MDHYRGKSKDSEKWVYGGISTIPKYNQAFINVVQNESYIASIEVDPESVGQYTGMELNDVKLYDGMKLILKNTFYFIEFDNSSASWVGKNNSLTLPLHLIIRKMLRNKNQTNQ